MKKQKQQTIPIVQQDLPHEETSLQIAVSLRTLEQVVINLFSNLESVIDKKKKRLHDIQIRCDIAKQQVQKLATIEKSIKVFSCYKYPAPKTDIFYKDPLSYAIEVNVPSVKIKCSSLSPDKCSLKEKLKFYHVRDSTQQLKQNCETTLLEGLGLLPYNCSKINSLLLYNTNQNLYIKYQYADPLSNITRPTDAPTDKKPSVQPDPISIGSNEPLGYKNIHHYSYSPSVQDVPDIEAPLNLPYLTGIAEDLNYNGAQIFRNIDYDNVSVTTEENIKLDAELTAINESIQYKSSNVTSPQPPPPPPPPTLPPVNFEIKNDTDHLANDKHKKPEVLVTPDARANLMEAIRQAGGKSKLKHVSNEKPDDKLPQKGKSLMDDLHEKLHMRRKGISGKVDNTDGMLDRIVSMIPPPPALIKQPDNEDDEDWDD